MFDTYIGNQVEGALDRLNPKVWTHTRPLMIPEDRKENTLTREFVHFLVKLTTCNTNY